MLILCLVAFLLVAVNLLDRLFHVGPGQTVDQDSLLILTILKKKEKKKHTVICWPYVDGGRPHLFSECEIQTQFYPLPPSPTPISQIFWCEPRKVFLICTCATDTEVAESIFSLDINSIISVASLFFWHLCIFISGHWISWTCGWALKLKGRKKKKGYKA